MNALIVLSILGAASLSPEVTRYLSSAGELYEALDYELAMNQVDRAQQYAHSPEDDVAVALYRGVLHAMLNHPDESNASFRVALSLDPLAALPLRVPPKLAKAFDAVRLEMAKAPLAPPPNPPPRVEPLSSAAAAAPAEVGRGEHPWRARAWIPAAGGVALGIAAALLYKHAGDVYGALRGPAALGPLDSRESSAMANEGNASQIGAAGAGLLAAGAVGLAGYLFFAKGKQPAISLSPAPGSSATLSMQASF